MDILSFFKCGRHFEKYIFPFPFTPTALIDDAVSLVTNRESAANMPVPLIKYQYIGTTDHLLHQYIYNCCKHTN